MFNDIYSPDQLPDFRLGAHPLPPHRQYVPQPPTNSDIEECEMDTDLHSASEPPLDPEQPSAPKQPPTSVQPLVSDTLLQLVDDVHRLSEWQQLILDILDTLSRHH